MRTSAPQQPYIHKVRHIPTDAKPGQPINTAQRKIKVTPATQHHQTTKRTIVSFVKRRSSSTALILKGIRNGLLTHEQALFSRALLEMFAIRLIDQFTQKHIA